MVLTLGVGSLSGSLSALFLWSLDRACSIRLANPQLLPLLPLAGIFTVWCYHSFGRDAARGNNLILERLLHDNGRVPARIVPLIFCGSFLSHLFGASTGREGAAVQMGAGAASLLHRVLRLPQQQYQRPLLVAGIAAGFASIFGTPFAGAIFALEMPSPGRLRVRHLPEALLAAFTADIACRAWGAVHPSLPFELPTLPQLLTPNLGGGILLCGLLFGWMALLFIRTLEAIQTLYRAVKPPWWLPPLAGGLLICALSQIPGSDSYLGLGTWNTRPDAVTIPSAFLQGGASDFSWLSKLGLTALSLGSGFKGGEVTPLFFMGATLGNFLAGQLHQAPSLFAALGFVAAFAGAAHTPVTGVIIAAEVFGITAAPLFIPACWLAHFACGRAGLYHGQQRKR